MVESIDVESAVSLQGRWAAGVAGGLVGGIGMGLILHAGSNMMPLIGALYGWPTVVGGWAAHLVNSALIGLVFPFIASWPFLRTKTTTVVGCVGIGTGYGAAVGLVTGGIMLPVALTAMGIRSFPEPLLPLPGILGGLLVVLSVGVAHLVYGMLLGAVYGIVTDASRAG